MPRPEFAPFDPTDPRDCGTRLLAIARRLHESLGLPLEATDLREIVEAQFPNTPPLTEAEYANLYPGVV